MTNLLEYRQITNYYVNSDRVQLGHFVISLTDIHLEHPPGTDASLVMKYKVLYFESRTVSNVGDQILEILSKCINKEC